MIICVFAEIQYVLVKHIFIIVSAFRRNHRLGSQAKVVLKELAFGIILQKNVMLNIKINTKRFSDNVTDVY